MPNTPLPSLNSEDEHEQKCSVFVVRTMVHVYKASDSDLKIEQLQQSVTSTNQRIQFLYQIHFKYKFAD